MPSVAYQFFEGDGFEYIEVGIALQQISALATQTLRRCNETAVGSATGEAVSFQTARAATGQSTSMNPPNQRIACSNGIALQQISALATRTLRERQALA